jgi:hypothetical protein
LRDECALLNQSFVESFDLNRLSFDPAEIRNRYSACKSSPEIYDWSFDPCVLRRFVEEECSNADEDKCAPEMLAAVGGD